MQSKLLHLYQDRAVLVVQAPKLEAEKTRLSLMSLAIEEIIERNLDLDWTDNQLFNTSNGNVEVDIKRSLFDKGLIRKEKLNKLGLSPRKAVEILMKNQKEILSTLRDLDDIIKLKDKAYGFRNIKKELAKMDKEIASMEKRIQLTKKFHMENNEKDN